VVAVAALLQLLEPGVQAVVAMEQQTATVQMVQQILVAAQAALVETV
jgi:hypothetical protein